MIDEIDAIKIAFRELTAEGVRPYFHTVPERAAQILARESHGTVTVDEAYQHVKQAIVELSKAGVLEGSLDPKDTWKLTAEILDYDIRRIAEPKLEALFRERQQAFSYRIADIHARFVKAGGVGGSAHGQVVRDTCEAELREGARAALACLRTIVSDLGVARSGELAQALKERIRKFLDDYRGAVTQAITISRGPSAGVSARNSLESEASELIATVMKESAADIELFSRARRRRTGMLQDSQEIQVRDNLIFLSHASSDARLAALLKEQIERSMPSVEVFCASYPGDITLGFRWSAEIQRALREAGSLLFIATSRSISRPWVWFEAGAFWFDRPILILCFGEVKKDSLPPPLNERQATNLNASRDLEALLDSLADTTGVAVSTKADLRQATDALAEAACELEANAAAAEGWRGVDWNGKFLATDGPLEALSLIDAAPYQDSMKEAFEVGGYKVVLGRPDQVVDFRRRGYGQVFLTDRRKWRCKIEYGDTVLFAGPASV